MQRLDLTARTAQIGCRREGVVTTVGISDERPNEPRRLRRDMAKIGQLVLDRGRWNGERVVSETWIKAATAPRSRRLSVGVMLATSCRQGRAQLFSSQATV